MHWNWTTPFVDLDSHAMNASLQEKQYNKLSYKQMMSLLKIFLEFK